MTDEQKKAQFIMVEAQQNYALYQVFVSVMKKHQEFTADDIFREIRISKAEVSPTYVSKHIGAFFKSLKAQGKIAKVGTYKLSERNGSSPLPIYRPVKNDVVTSNN